MNLHERISKRGWYQKIGTWRGLEKAVVAYEMMVERTKRNKK